MIHGVEGDPEVLGHREGRGRHAQTPVVPEAGAGDGEEVDLEHDPAVQGGERAVQGEEDGEPGGHQADVDEDAEQTHPRPVGVPDRQPEQDRHQQTRPGQATPDHRLQAVKRDAGRDVVQLQQRRQLDEREQSQQEQPDPRHQPLAALTRLDDLPAPFAERTAKAMEAETPASREVEEKRVR